MDMGKQVLVVFPTQERYIERFRREFPDVDFIFSTQKTVTREMVEDAEAIIGSVPAAFLKNAAKLRWLQLQSSGVDAYVKPGVLPDAVTLCNSAGAYNLAVAEHMLTLQLMLLKNMHLYRDSQMEEHWSDHGRVRSIYGSRQLIIGMGDIGMWYAKQVKALGAVTIGVKRTKTSKMIDYFDEQHTIDELDELLPTADCVTLIIPATPESVHMINADRLKLMQKHALLINGGRGSLIDTDALMEALSNKTIGGAGLDVTDPEPLPDHHPLWKCGNIVISPHTAGGDRLDYTIDRNMDIFTRNLRLYLDSQPLTNVARPAVK